MAQKVLHKRSNELENGAAKLPAASGLSYGEIAINYKAGNETIALKNDEDKVVSFNLGDAVWEKGTGENSVQQKGTGAVASGKFSVAEGSGTTATGEFSHAEGYGAAANNNRAHAEGFQTLAEGSTTHAEGYRNYAIGHFSHAEGNGTAAVGNFSHSECGNSAYVVKLIGEGNSLIYSGTTEGESSQELIELYEKLGPTVFAQCFTNVGVYLVNNLYVLSRILSFEILNRNDDILSFKITLDKSLSPSSVNGDAHIFGSGSFGRQSHSEGRGTKTVGENSHSEGHLTIALGNNSHAEGDYTFSSGDSSHAEGSGATASGKASHAEGHYTSALTEYSHAEGQNTKASGKASHAEGNNTIASSNYSHAEGTVTTASGNYSHAEGSGTTASKNGAHAEGSNTTASGVYSHAEGYYTTASGSRAHAEGWNTKALGIAPHAEGSGTTASGSSSHAEGYNTTAAGNYSHAEGDWTIASGSSSHAEGGNTTATGNYSHAEGRGTTASGSSSHAEGYNTTAAGYFSHAEGDGTTASGARSHAEGFYTTAAGDYSHAEGTVTTASGEASHAEGCHTTAKNASEHAEGQYNVSNSATTVYGNSGNTQHSIGIGTSTADTKNAFEIMQNGDAYLYGIGSYDGTNASASTSNTLQKTINDIQASTEEICWEPGIGLGSIQPKSRAGFVWEEAGSARPPVTIKEGAAGATRYLVSSPVTELSDYYPVGTYFTIDKANVGAVVSYEPNPAMSMQWYMTVSNTLNPNSSLSNVSVGYYSYGNGTIPSYCSATGEYSYAEGYKTLASGNYTHAEGYATSATVLYAHAEGLNSKAIDVAAHAEGEGSQAFGRAAHAEGGGTKATAMYTHAEGCETHAGGQYAHAEGYNTKATEMSAHAEGFNTSALTEYSHAEGNGTRASGEASHVEGNYTKASGEASHAEGNYTIAQGFYSHAEGEDTSAIGSCAHAEGSDTTASGSRAHAEGTGTIAKNNAEHAEGQYNVSNSATTTYGSSGNTQHSVGIGTSDSNKKNAFEIMQNGDAYLYGVGGYNGTNPQSASTLQQCIGKMQEITWSALKSLRDSSGLTPGMQYRITDYNTTTVQADTQAAGHQFDIIVVADDNHTLNENARACLHSGDTYFSGLEAKLESWELKYCLDNDTTRFLWADSGSTGRGVIYRMIDEWGNDCPYDFKNIQFLRSASWFNTHSDWCESVLGMQPTVDSYFYTFTWFQYYTSQDCSLYGLFETDNNGEYNGVFNNKMGRVTACARGISSTSLAFCLNDNVFVSSNDYQFLGGEFTGIKGNIFSENCYSNTFGNNGSYNTFGNEVRGNVFLNDCDGNTFGYRCASNTFGNNCYYNTFGNYCHSNTFGNNCNNNTFGNYCHSNTFGEGSCSDTFGNNCISNTFGNYCNDNTFGNRCEYNKFGNRCDYNTFGESVHHFITGNATGATTSAQTKGYIKYLIVENGVQNVNAYCTGTTSSSNCCQNIKIGLGIKGTSSSDRLQIDITQQIGATASVTYQPANSQVINI